MFSFFNYFRVWRVTHILSHHLYTNTLQDYEISTFEPIFMWMPNKTKTFINKYVAQAYAIIIYIFVSDFQILTRWVFWLLLIIMSFTWLIRWSSRESEIRKLILNHFHNSNTFESLLNMRKLNFILVRKYLRYEASPLSLSFLRYWQHISTTCIQFLPSVVKNTTTNSYLYY